MAWDVNQGQINNNININYGTQATQQVDASRGEERHSKVAEILSALNPLNALAEVFKAAGSKSG